MERGDKKHKTQNPVYILGLGHWIPQRDVRKIIWKKLNYLDKLMVWAAHGVNKWMEDSVDGIRYDCALYGYFDLIFYFLTEKKDAVRYFMTYGAMHGHLNMVEWVFINYPEDFDSELIAQKAAYGGAVKILEYIGKLGKSFCSDFLCQEAACNNQTAFVKWGDNRGYKLSHGCLEYFIFFDNVELVKLYLSKKTHDDDLLGYILDRAISHNSFKVVEFITETKQKHG
jgi:hypothetical protein